MPESVLVVDDLHKTYATGAATTPAIGGMSFALKPQEFLAIVGPSGCGKTTLLRCISGLLRPDSGVRTIDGVPHDGIPGNMSVVFQEYNRSLFPWLSVTRNVRFPLSKLPRGERTARASEALRLVNLEEFGDHYPWQLSGGMQQRVGIARAIASHPELLLMDEPFASVDAQTRIALENMLLELWERLSLSVVFVTHDIDEAIYLADRILVLSARPSRVIKEIDVNLPRPRDQLTTKSDPRFDELRREVFAQLREGAGAEI